LALAVRPQPSGLASEPGFRKAIDNAVGERNRQRHQLGRVAARVPKHEALVASPDILAGRGVGVHAHRDVLALLAQVNANGARIGADAHLVVDVANIANRIADDFLVVDIRVGRDFASDDRQARRDQRLTRHSAKRIDGEKGVEHAVRDLIGQLVRMPHADRFTGEQILSGCHERTPLG
jgi:hypothetical protein